MCPTSQLSQPYSASIRTPNTQPGPVIFLAKEGLLGPGKLDTSMHTRSATPQPYPSKASQMSLTGTVLMSFAATWGCPKPFCVRRWAVGLRDLRDAGSSQYISSHLGVGWMTASSPHKMCQTYSNTAQHACAQGCACIGAAAGLAAHKLPSTLAAREMACAAEGTGRDYTGGPALRQLWQPLPELGQKRTSA